jgi:hypothetical protein
MLEPLKVFFEETTSGLRVGRRTTEKIINPEAEGPSPRDPDHH